MTDSLLSLAALLAQDLGARVEPSANPRERRPRAGSGNPAPREDTVGVQRDS